MKQLQRLIAALLVIAGITPAIAQMPNLPSGTVWGRTQSGTGPGQAIPFATLIATMLASSPTIPTVNTSSIIFAGSTSGTATVSAQAVAGTTVIKLPTVSGTLLDNATLPIVGSATTGNVSCPNCAIAISTRTAAAAQDLSSYSVVRTLGYATAGDGGGALFYKLTGTQFLDQNIASGTISGNGTSTCTNNTYQVYGFTGGSGTGFMATVTAAGNIVTTITKMFNAGGFGYAVGDVLSTTITGCSTTVTYTVSTVTTPKASFTDSAGNKWQYRAEQFIDPRQFGAKFDWLGTDGSATDDYASIQAAIDYGSYVSSINGFTTNGAPLGGTTVLIPRGIAMVCSPLTLWGSVNFRGQGINNSGLHMCDAWASGATHFLTMCDSAAHVACFGGQISDMSLAATTAANANAATYMIYTNAAQQARAISNVTVYGGKRGCLRYDTGYGGAAGFYVYDMICTLFTASGSDGIVVNGGTTEFKFFNTIIESSSYAGSGFNLLGGQITIDGLHTEGIVTGINISMATATHSATLMHATGGSGCTELVKLQAANTLGNFALFDAVKNGCTRLVTDGQPAGANRTTDAQPKDGWVSFNP